MRLNPFSKYVRIVRKVTRFFSHKQYNYKKTGGEKLKTNDRNYYKKQTKSVDTTKNDSTSFSEAKVIRVIDGDTVIVRNQKQEIRVRLDSIDCPEDGQEWGDIAKFGLVKLIGGRMVRLEDHGVDTHGRTLATIFVWQEQKCEWLNVNERMVTLGHAWVMRLFYKHLPKDRQNKLNRLERWAKAKRVGLWQRQNPIPPWTWRNTDD